ncbi:MAG: hypothetical protein Ta2A_26030 [Treponemataceae bacterium]|nr:MAG: hypothetical protein Ta2A_26030 [Treponemataceae bacterium]
MGREIIEAQLSRLEEMGKRVAEKATWQRREGFNLTYDFGDALKSAFGLFLFQNLSMLSYQESPDRGNLRKNAEKMLKVKEIPCSNQITRLIDEVDPDECAENFKDGLKLAKESGVLEQYKALGGGVLIALDGVWFHSSKKVRCDHCLRITKGGRDDILSQHDGSGAGAPRQRSGAAADAGDDPKRRQGQRGQKRHGQAR